MPTPAAKPAPSAADVLVALRLRFAEPEWMVLAEVASPHADRHVDALAISTWQSRGLSIIGIEIKAARADWLRELKDPSKADAFARFVDQWWVAAPKGVIETPEVPPAWGFLELVGDVLRRRKWPDGVEAVSGRKKRSPAPPVARTFMVRILNRVLAAAARRDQARRDGEKSGEEERAGELQKRAWDAEAERQRLVYEVQDLKRELHAAKELLGVVAATTGSPDAARDVAELARRLKPSALDRVKTTREQHAALLAAVRHSDEQLEALQGRIEAWGGQTE